CSTGHRRNNTYGKAPSTCARCSVIRKRRQWPGTRVARPRSVSAANCALVVCVYASYYPPSRREIACASLINRVTEPLGCRALTSVGLVVPPPRLRRRRGASLTAPLPLPGLRAPAAAVPDVARSLVSRRGAGAPAHGLAPQWPQPRRRSSAP